MKMTPWYCTVPDCQVPRMAEVYKSRADQCAGCSWFFLTADMKMPAGSDLERSFEAVRQIAGKPTRCSRNLGGLKHANG